MKRTQLISLLMSVLCLVGSSLYATTTAHGGLYTTSSGQFHSTSTMISTGGSSHHVGVVSGARPQNIGQTSGSAMAMLSPVGAGAPVHVEAASGNLNPFAEGNGSGPRRTPPTTGGDKDNPQLGPIGDGVWCLLLLAIAFAILRTSRKSLRFTRSHTEEY